MLDDSRECNGRRLHISLSLFLSLSHTHSARNVSLPSFCAVARQWMVRVLGPGSHPTKHPTKDLLALHDDGGTFPTISRAHERSRRGQTNYRGLQDYTAISRCQKHGVA